MSGQGLLGTLASLLAAGVMSVPVAKRLGLGSVLGYLVAGALIGPFGLKLLANSNDVMHVAEFGVVMLLFLVGLELEPRRLWAMRGSIFGLGTVQVVSCSLAIAGCMLLLGWNASGALVAGLGFAMSSTAIVLQILAERGLTQTTVGKDSFAVLLYQDLAVIPILAVLPLLGTASASAIEGQSMTPMMRTLLAIGIVVGLFVASRTVVKPLFRWIAKTRQKEIFTATSLFIVVGIALLMDSIGLSMALGTFLAGVVLADCEYRHELESNIEPFKGLLLGIFFTAVGSSMQFSILAMSPMKILGVVGLLLVCKIILLKLSAHLFKHESRNAWLFSVLLSQGGEFAFVLFSAARGFGALTEEQASELTLIVALSMFTTPFLLKGMEKYLKRDIVDNKKQADKIDPHDHPVIIAGMGRFGQIVARLLHTQGISPTIIDYSPDLLELVRPFGFKVYYGDATELSLLESAGVAQAKVLVLALDDREGCLRAAESVRKHYPNVRIVARAFDMIHAYQLKDIGVDDFERETFNAALSLGERILVSLGFHPHAAHKNAKIFHRYDNTVLHDLHRVYKQRSEYVVGARAAREELEKLFAADEMSMKDGHADAAWVAK
jgi:glutathione-regulated potassium-efflux system ancillary protein KefC